MACHHQISPFGAQRVRLEGAKREQEQQGLVNTKDMRVWGQLGLHVTFLFGLEYTEDFKRHQSDAIIPELQDSEVVQALWI